MARPSSVKAGRSVTKRAATTAKKEEEDVQLFRDWVSHSDRSFHEFDPETAAKIQKSLLSWYYDNRRKLPWRGDPPPYDGSTAGFKYHGDREEAISAAQQTPNITTSFQPTKKAKTKTEIKSEDAPISTDKNPVSAYGVWVSEVMLQQTRVEAVIPYWIKWMQTFPTVHDLASATESQVNAHWAGLGFYRRARMLHQGAQLVVKEYNGELPQTVEELLKITGIGRYTASAIASIAFGVNVPVVDGNVCRVLSRLTGIANHIKAPVLKDKLGWDLATQLVRDSPHPGDVNQALMELGATYCAPSGTGIHPQDPLKDFYFSTRIAKGYYNLKRQGEDYAMLTVLETCKCPICDPSGVKTAMDQLEERILVDMKVEDARREGHAIFPLDPPKTKRREEHLAVGVISTLYKEELWWLLIRRPEKGLLAGQWEFPSVCIGTCQEGQTDPPSLKPLAQNKALTEYLQMIVQHGDQAWSVTDLSRMLVNPTPLEHIFSHVKHTMWLETASVDTSLSVKEWTTHEGRKVQWMRASEMKEVGITAEVKKILNAVQAPSKKRKTVAISKRKG
jgi:A/G-specific adenine glycosylase